MQGNDDSEQSSSEYSQSLDQWQQALSQELQHPKNLLEMKVQRYGSLWERPGNTERPHAITPRVKSP